MLHSLSHNVCLRGSNLSPRTALGVPVLQCGSSHKLQVLPPINSSCPLQTLKNIQMMSIEQLRALDRQCAAMLVLRLSEGIVVTAGFRIRAMVRVGHLTEGVYCDAILHQTRGG